MEWLSEPTCIGLGLMVRFIEFAAKAGRRPSAQRPCMELVCGAIPLPRRLDAVRLLASARRNVTVKAAAPRSQGAPRLDFSVAWPAAAICQERVELPPWQPVYATCWPAQGKAPSASAPLLTDRLLLQLADTTAAANATADDLTLQLCGLALFGLPAAAGS